MQSDHVKAIEANLPDIIATVRRLGNEAKAWREDLQNRIQSADYPQTENYTDASGKTHEIITHSNDPKVIGQLKHTIKREIAPWDGKYRNSPATSEDIRLGDELCKRLKALTPQVPVISEENSAEQNEQIRRQDPKTYWSIDPIDGTSNFIEPKKNYYGILIGLVENGKPTFGITYYPEFDLLTYTSQGKAWQQHAGATKPLTIAPALNPSPAQGSWAQAETRPVKQLRITKAVDIALEGKTLRPTNGDEALKHALILNRVQTSIDPTIVSAGDFPDDMWLLKGNADLTAFNLAGYEWDIAARQAIIEAAGGKVVLKESGEAPDYGHREDLFMNPLWCGHEETLAKLSQLAKSPEALLPSGSCTR